MSTLSVIIITKNEEKNIERCLASASFANEIIVVDSGSTDKTAALCLKHTPHFFSMDWPGFGKQKNRALCKATQEWVLSLDADEIIPPLLAEEIQNLIQTGGPYDGYLIPRNLIFCGKVMKYANGKDYKLRLFKRTLGKFDDKPVHETILLNGKLGKLNAPLLHYSAADISDWLNKMNHYSALDAQQKLKQGKSASLLKAIIHASWMFLRVYFLRAGFLDGGAGFILAVTFAEGSFYRYIKMIYPE